MKFTIAIPAYKASYLKECLLSIVNQTFRDFEIVIVNDASPENLSSIVEDFDIENLRYYVNEKNFGSLHVVDNWNKCLDYARGDYFILMGDDDKILPTYLEEFNLLIEKYPNCGVYHCRTIIIDESGHPVAVTEPRPEFESVYDSIFERMKEHRIFFISDYVYNSKKLRENGGFFKLPLAWASDDISAYIGAKDHGIAHTNKPLFIYRRNSQTISSTGNVASKMQAILEEEAWLRAFVMDEPVGELDQVLRKNISDYITTYIQKKKIYTIYTYRKVNPITLIWNWFPERKKIKLSIVELTYAALMSVKENWKKKYE